MRHQDIRQSILFITFTPKFYDQGRLFISLHITSKKNEAFFHHLEATSSYMLAVDEGHRCNGRDRFYLYVYMATV